MVNKSKMCIVVALAFIIALSVCLFGCSNSSILKGYDSSGLKITAEDKDDITYGEANFKAMSVTDGDYEMKYRIYIPKSASSEKAAVLLFFHGIGERGSNNISQINIAGFRSLFTSQTKINDFIVIAPQCPKSDYWVGFNAMITNDYSVDELSETKPLETVLKVLKFYDESREVKVDTDRIYAMGMSMGGYATWDLLVRHNDLIAAAVPICGGCDVSKAEVLKTTPVYTFHGSEDVLVPPAATRKMAEAQKQLGNSKFIYVEYEGEQHDIWNTAMRTDGLIDWLYSNKLSDR